jgi:hypothetical protein
MTGSSSSARHISHSTNIDWSGGDNLIWFASPTAIWFSRKLDRGAPRTLLDH